MGVRPLYYADIGGTLFFASEIKALLQDPQQERAVHEEAFFHYLSFLTTPAPPASWPTARPGRTSPLKKP